MTHTLIDIKTLKALIQDADPAAVARAKGLIFSPLLPQVIANMTGGVLQGSSSNYPVELYILDFDDDDYEIDGGLCSVSQTYPLIDRDFVAEVLNALNK